MNDPRGLFDLFLALVVLVVLLRSFLPGRKPRQGQSAAQDRPSGPVRAAPEIETRANSILVDGSNVMFWDGNTPTASAITRTLHRLKDSGNDPILCFDANVGYKLAGRHLGEGELSALFGIPAPRILVCPSGTDADAMILRLAAAKGLPVVSNDRFRDYPDLAARVPRMSGTIEAEKVSLRLHAASHRHRRRA